MAGVRALTVAALALVGHLAAASAAELPTEVKKTKAPAPAAKSCNIAGVPGVVAANGVCVRLSGYVSAGFGGGRIK